MTRDTILLFTSIREPVQALSDEDAGKLLKAILDYQTGEEVKLDGLLKVVFLQVKQQIDYNNEKYESITHKRSEAGKKGMASRWGNNKDNCVIGVITNDNKNNLNDNENVNVINKHHHHARVRESEEEFDPLIESYAEFMKRKRG